MGGEKRAAVEIGKEVELFDGRSMRGWYAPEGGWRVKDGALVGDCLNQRVARDIMPAVEGMERWLEYTVTIDFEVTYSDANGRAVITALARWFPAFNKPQPGKALTLGPANVPAGRYTAFFHVEERTFSFYVVRPGQAPPRRLRRYLLGIPSPGFFVIGAGPGARVTIHSVRLKVLKLAPKR